jgi:hypothetical protein
LHQGGPRDTSLKRLSRVAPLPRLDPARRRVCIEHVQHDLHVSERRAYAALRQHRSTLGKVPRGPEDEERLNADMIAGAITRGFAHMLRLVVGPRAPEVFVPSAETVPTLTLPPDHPKGGRSPPAALLLNQQLVCFLGDSDLVDPKRCRRMAPWVVLRNKSTRSDSVIRALSATPLPSRCHGKGPKVAGNSFHPIAIKDDQPTIKHQNHRC